MGSQPSEVKVDVSGLDRILQTEPERVEAWLDMLSEDIVTDTKLSFGTSPPGREYTRGGVTHVASQPGYPPNVDIASLTNSIHWKKTGKLERTVSDGVAHGVWMEDGTERIKPRPWMRPAFDRIRQRMERDAANRLRLE